MNNRIRELRKELKITQEEFACAIGVTRQTIISLENGKYKYNASLCLAYKISSFLVRRLKMFSFLRRVNDGL